MKKVRIVVAEDESIIALDLKLSLERLGYFVICTVNTGELAIRKASDLHPDVMVMDIGLDDNLDGLAAASVIWESNKIPVVFVSAYPGRDRFSDSRIPGVAGFLPKPFGKEELKEHIERALNIGASSATSIPC